MHLTAALTPWSSHDTRLILSCALGLALIIVFISALKLAPFLSILIGTQTLVAAGISTTIGKIAVGAHMPLLLLAWLIAVALRQATGSATVATTTTAGIVAPVVVGLSATHNSLMALAIGAGSVFFCHVNDAGFWMVREYFGLQLKQTVFVWSILQTIVSVVGLVGTLVLWGVLS